MLGPVVLQFLRTGTTNLTAFYIPVAILPVAFPFHSSITLTASVFILEPAGIEAHSKPSRRQFRN